jgi:spore maturation protein CgeB
LASIPLFDHLFAYRHRNITDFVKCGARSVSLLRSFYLRDQNFPIPGAEKGADVSFIGHWENDGREASVSAILDLPEVRFRLWGTGWHLSPNATDLARKLGPIEPLRGSAYNLAINRSRISLVFLSSINHDTYTRRCFEIPAAGGFMLAPYTDDLASLFREGREAEYFRSRDEMLDKIRFYLSHEAQRSRIAEAGRERLLYEGHEALDRARQMRDDMRRLL